MYFIEHLDWKLEATTPNASLDTEIFRKAKQSQTTGAPLLLFFNPIVALGLPQP